MELAQQVDAMRRFTRFYTRQAGVLNRTLLDSPFTPPEARVLYELGTVPDLTAGRLSEMLVLDAGYMSRLLQSLERQGILSRTRSDVDRRSQRLALTPKGEAAFNSIDQQSREENSELLSRLDEGARTRLMTAMQTIQTLLDDYAPKVAPYILRPHRPGDIGWVISRHGALYAQEYGWDISFEALVAEIAGAFLRNFDPARECCWIAERDGVNLGCAFVVRQSDDIAKLRLVLVDPSARGLGLGRRLVDECIRFAKNAGYRGMTLWTNDILHAARKIYQDCGFVLVAEENHYSFGQHLVGQNWDLTF